MNILFVSSGNSKNGISLIVKNQGQSLKDIGLKVDYFTIKGKGLKGYLKSINLLKKQVNLNNYDIIHAHYSLSGYLVAISGINKPIVVSLMGSDIMAKEINQYIIKFFYKYKWNSLIVKSKSLSDKLQLKNINIIPNGVDFNLFKPLDKRYSMNRIRLDNNKKHVLFAASPNRLEKNFNLAKKAFDNLNIDHIELHCLDNIDYKDIPFYMNACNVILLTSLWEGSPNVIKEAMACNRPIVSTDIGDVRNIIQNTKGCYICSYDSKDIAEKISLALKFKNTNGRIKIDYLKRENIAKKILTIYSDLMLEIK